MIKQTPLIDLHNKLDVHAMNMAIYITLLRYINRKLQTRTEPAIRHTVSYSASN